MTAALLSIGTAAPDIVLAQETLAELACRLSDCNGKERALREVYRRSGVLARGSMLADKDGRFGLYEEPQGGTPSTGERLAVYTALAIQLASRACRRAIEVAGVDVRKITHLVTVSCTGFEAPGVDCGLIRSLGLSRTVRRTHIGFMGCHGAVNGLAVAKAYAEADPDACVLVCCVELCSLHFQSSGDASVAVSNALFADGAAAAVVSAHAPANSPRIRSAHSIVVPDTEDLMTWRIGDSGFVMTLSNRVPDVLARFVPDWIGSWLSEQGVSGVEDVRSWAIHPGGPRVVRGVTDALRLRPEYADDSMHVLASHGNMSSPTVLFIAERRLNGRVDEALPMVMLAFGPGLTGEALLLTRGD